MPASAQTDAFLLGQATVMLGDMADLFDLKPSTHSVGLVKNFQVSNEPSYLDLTQGVQNTNVYSVLVGNAVRASMEVYEYTAKNLTYALGLDGTDVAKKTAVGAVDTQVVGDGSTTDDIVLGTGEGTNFAQGDHISIAVDSDDNILVRKIASISTDTLTLDRAIPTGITVPVGAAVKELNTVPVGSKTVQPFFGAKIVGKLVNGDPVLILLPKVRITRGFSLAFNTDNYGNLPFELTVFDLVATDALYSEFGTDGGRIYRQ